MICFANQCFAQLKQFSISDFENPLKYSYINKGDSLMLVKELNKIKQFYQLKGYAEFHYDSIELKGNIFIVKPFIGETFKYTLISRENYKILGFDNAILDTNNLNFKIFNQLEILEQNGYPFAQFQIDSYSLKNNHLEIFYSIDKKQLFRYDSAFVYGDGQIKRSFLEAVCNIKQGKIYNQKEIEKAAEKLNQLPFIYCEDNPQVAFSYFGKARPYFKVNKRKSDQVNGFVGIAPSNNTVGLPQNVITGELLIKLNNMFSSGKQMHLNIRSFKARSQEIYSMVSLPYLFNLPYGVNAKINYTKFDTIFATFQNRIGFNYFFSGLNNISFFYESLNTNLLTLDTNDIKIKKTLPIQHSATNKLYGISLDLNKLNNNFNPQKGFNIQITAQIGTRNIEKEAIIEELKFKDQNNNFYSLYDNLKLSQNQYKFKVNGEKYFKLKSKSAIKFGILLDHNISNQLFQNEISRFGGLNNLKGFNEQSIFATNFNMFDVEYRFLTSEFSHLKVFFNMAYYENKILNIIDNPYGFGIGGTLETRAGVLNLIYALGSEFNNGIDLRIGKFHFGLINYF